MFLISENPVFLHLIYIAVYPTVSKSAGDTLEVITLQELEVVNGHFEAPLFWG